MSSYERERMSSLHSAVVDFAQDQIQTARDTYTQLEQSLHYFRQLETKT